MSLLRSFATVGGWTFVSRVLGFVRDAIIARTFGAGLATDAFFVAFRIPNLLRRLFAEGAFAQAFVPILGEYKTRRGAADARDLVDRVTTLLAVILVGVTILGMAAAGIIVMVSAPGFAAQPEKYRLTAEMLRITFPYIFFISLVALAGGILNTWRQFAVPAFTPTLLNVAFIVAALGFAPYFDPPIKVLAWAVLAGGALQLAAQVPALARIGMLPRWRWAPRDEGVQRVLKLILPAIFGVSVAQISLLLNTVFASFLATGSVSWLYYADRLMEFPTGLLGVAIGTILLPSLTKTYADHDVSGYSKLLDWGLRMTVMLAVPAAAALALLAVPLIATLFYHGAFTVHDVNMTRQALLAYSVGLVGLILVKILAPGFYARQNVTTPVRIAILTLVGTQLLNLVLVGPLAHAGLALAIALGACFNAALLYWKLRTHSIYQPQPGWLAFVLRVALAVLVMAGVLYLINPPSSWWTAVGTVERVLWLTLLVVTGAASYFSALFALGFRLRDFRRADSSS